MWKVLNLWRFKDIARKQIIKNFNEIIQNDLSPKIEKYSPVDEWTYIEWNVESLAAEVGGKIKASVSNISDEAYGVEFWFRSTPVNWHKNRKLWWPVIFNWIGARVYTRTYDETEEAIRNKIKNNIKIK